VADYHYCSDEATWDDHFLRSRVSEILRASAPPPRRVFELGCGNGAIARMLAAEGYTVTAVDPSRSGIEIAKKFEHERLRFEVGSTDENLAATYGQFPVVLSLEVIEHCPSAQQFMQTFASLLAPQGLGLISTPYHGYWKNLAVIATGRFDRHFDPLWEGGHVKFFTRAKLGQLLEAHALTQYKIHRLGRVPPLARSMLAEIHR